mgnify:CR=1 FL=1
MTMSETPIVVMVSVPSAEIGKTIARFLVEERLAACVQAMPIASTYRWEGEVESDDEVLLLIKTRAENFAQLEAAVVDLHPYEVPEIMSLPVGQVHQRYLNWLVAETSPE